MSKNLNSIFHAAILFAFLSLPTLSASSNSHAFSSKSGCNDQVIRYFFAFSCQILEGYKCNFRENSKKFTNNIFIFFAHSLPFYSLQKPQRGSKESIVNDQRLKRMNDVGKIYHFPTDFKVISFC